ncbi:MAG: DUF2335 domain-containing protein [Ignavibacteriaceae bacterium]
MSNNPRNKSKQIVTNQNSSLTQKQTATSLLAASHFSGPIPPPNLLKQYEEINPGFANRIMKQAEEQTAHRIEIENKVIDSDITKSYLGLIFAFIIGFTGIAGGIYLTAIGLTNPGLLISGASVVSLAGAFIYGTNSKRKASAKK